MQHPWMKLYVGDYLADTGHLTTRQHGVYLLLIMHHWANGSLPESKHCYGIARCLGPDAEAEAQTILDEFFEKTQSGYIHRRVLKELADAGEAYERRAKAGRKGAKTRWQCHSKESDSNAIAFQNQNQSQSQSQKSDVQSTPPLSPPPGGRKRKSPTKPIPEDWQPDQRAIAFCQTNALGLDAEARRFRLHAEQNDRRCVRWDAAFLMWLDKSARDGRNNGRKTRVEQIEEFNRRSAEIVKAELAAKGVR